MLTWSKGLIVLFLYIVSQIIYSIVKRSQGDLTLEVIQTVFSSLPQGLFVILIFAVVMYFCTLWKNGKPFSAQASGFMFGLLIYTLFDYFYINYLKSLDLNFLTFAGFIVVFNFTFLIAVHMLVSSLEKKKADQEIKLREEVYRRLVEESPDAIAISVKRQWKFINNSLVTLFGGESKEQLIAIPSYDFVHKDYVEMNKARISQVEAGKTAELAEQVLLKLNGEPFYGETLSIPTIYEGEPAIHTIIRDVTKRKEEQAKLVQAEKLSMAGQLAAGIAHEIRNPLTAIKGFVKMLRTNPKDEYFDIISNEIIRIEDIITELLMLTKHNRTEFQEIDVTQTIKQVVTLLEPQANLKNIVFETVYCDKKTRILGDENKLKQAYINFLKNAIEAMPNGGTIQIKTDCTEENMEIEFMDHGIGIPAEKLKNIGDPFYTTKENGTGLGFMVSRKIVEDHNGQLTIMSTEGKGTSIKILFPIVKGVPYEYVV
ncbi:ATP-binding protein [Ammoniphilus resinae]|uniref:ATP-binding protein n=1 Tax=Ammoniphilus resinae TaxID=861532 RepID=UPI001AE95908